MKAAYYERNGGARDVLKVGHVDTPRPGPGEVRVKLAVSGVNPSDVKSRQGSTRKIAYPRVIPHSDGAGVIDEGALVVGGVGEGERAEPGLELAGGCAGLAEVDVEDSIRRGGHGQRGERGAERKTARTNHPILLQIGLNPFKPFRFPVPVAGGITADGVEPIETVKD